MKASSWLGFDSDSPTAKDDLIAMMKRGQTPLVTLLCLVPVVVTPESFNDLVQIGTIKKIAMALPF